MIKAIIFDCFGVLTTGVLNELKHKYPHSVQGILRIHELFDENGRPLNEFIDEMSKTVGVDRSEIANIVGNIREKSVRNNQLLELIVDLKSQYKIGLLSNAIKGQLDLFFTDDEKKRYFDDIVQSNEVHLVKPDPKIYNLAATRLHMSPAECIFVDDKNGNIVGAEAVGMKGIVYENFDDFKIRLAEILERENA